MSLKIVIPNADFSGLGNPKVETYINGLPEKNLAALYLFDEAVAVGQAYAVPGLDQSGNGNVAALIAGSAAFKTAGGVASSTGSTRTKGFGLMSPVRLTSKFTVFGISRNLMAASVPAGAYMMPYSSSGNWPMPAAPDVADINAGGANTGGLLHLNHVNNGPSFNYAELASYSQTAPSGGPTNWGGVSRPDVNNVDAAKNSWIAWALSFDSSAGYTMRAMGGGHTISDPVAANAWSIDQIAKNAKHVFGAMGYQDTLIVGEMAMAGVYKDVAKTAGEMDALIVRMKARLAARLGTIL